MTFPQVSEAEKQRRLDVYARHAGKPGAVKAAAMELGLRPHSLSKWLMKHGRHLHAPKLTAAGPKESAPEPPRREMHDAAFWRKKHATLLREISALEHITEKLAGVRDVPYSVPEWALPVSSGRSHSVVGCLLSDVHMGEVIAPDELHGLNAFNEAICRARLRRYFGAVCTLGQRWASDTDCQGVLLALAGDLISGDIHEELRITNDLTAHEQVAAMVEEVVAGIGHLKETFGRVHVVCVPGNHGRNTPKPTAKMYSRLSYDMMIGAMIARHFANDPRVTFQQSAAKDQMTPIFGRTVFTTHGDKIGTKGGMGFAGPMLPIVRGANKIKAQQASMGRRIDLIQFGHYHTTGNPGDVLANGSVPGYSEYGDDLRAVVEPPQQWAYLLHSKWWLRERMPVQLEEPTLGPKPRIRIPANWGETDATRS